jgi:hypothetical protein
MEQRKALPLLVVAMVFGLLALIWFFPPTGDFRTGNPFWNGLSVFADSGGSDNRSGDGIGNATSIQSLADLPQNGTGYALIEIPYTPFSSGDLDILKGFTQSGGVLIVMDDYGYGNQILERLGTGIRFSGKPLLDPLYNYKNPLFPRISDFAPQIVAVESISLNHATSLEDVPQGAVIALSSSFSYLDTDGSGTRTASDAGGPRVVVAYEKFENGYAIMISDPSLIINSMLGVDENRALTSLLINFGSSATATPDSRSVLVDQSHLPREPLDDAKLILAASYSLASSPLGAAAIIVALLAISTLPIWRNNENGSAGVAGSKPRSQNGKDEDHQKVK